MVYLKTQQASPGSQFKQAEAKNHSINILPQVKKICMQMNLYLPRVTKLNKDMRQKLEETNKQTNTSCKVRH